MGHRHALAGIAAISFLCCTASSARADEEEEIGPPRPPAPATTRVHVRFPTGERLPYLEIWSPAGWTLACKAPCDVDLPSDGQYRVRGRTGDAGRPFFLPDADQVRVDAAVGETSRAGWGVLALSGSAVALGGGAAIALPSGEEKASRVIVGVAMSVLGLTLGYIGLTKLLGAGTTADVIATSSRRGSSPPSDPKPTGGLRWTGTSLAF